MSVFLGLRKIIYLDANSTVNGSVVLVTPTGFSISVQSGKKYILRAKLYTTTGATPGIKIQFTNSAVATLYQASALLIDKDTPTITPFSIVASASMGVADDIDTIDAEFTCVPSADGTIALQFAQQVSDASNTVILAGSFIEVISL